MIRYKKEIADESPEEDMDEQELEQALEREMEQQAGEGEDFYFTTDEYAQVRTESLIPEVISEEVSFHTY